MNSESLQARIEELRRNAALIEAEGRKAEQNAAICREQFAIHQGGIMELERLLAQMQQPPESAEGNAEK